MGFIVEQECPQCGAPIELDETDRILLCPYCNVKSFLYTPRYFRYILPNNASDKDIIYAPYLRFKGNVFFCKGMTIGHRIIDITQLGLELNGLPISLGIRPQAMKLRFAIPETNGNFMRFTLKAADILTRAAKLSSGPGKGDILHRAFIGETMSLIYLPLYMRGDRIFDAILNRPIAGYRFDPSGMESLFIKKLHRTMTFIPTLCPLCGWNLNGERDSIVLTCENCGTAWEAMENRFVQVRISIARSDNKESLYLPFWKLTAHTRGVDMKSFADFIRLTNQPRIIGHEWKKEDMNFWSPAFKIRPKIFLSLSKQFTVLQEQFKETEEFTSKKLFPASLPRSEAVQALKIILAHSTVTKKNVLPHLPKISFKINDSTLVYLPFMDTSHELIQEHIGISINKKTLEYGRSL
jgi:DNA-directed RNA polymerase subunit RPC12/RpoP